MRRLLCILGLVLLAACVTTQYGNIPVSQLTDVALMLAKPPQRTDYLKLFLDAARDSRSTELNLFTLNHDTLLEQCFKGKFDVTDGFEAERNLTRNDLGIRRWTPELFDQTPPSRGMAAVRLFKLHGSINWFRFGPEQRNEENPWLEEYIGIQSDPSLPEARDLNRRRHGPIGRPLSLVGTFNKMIHYTDRVFFEMHYRFIRALDSTERLIVCGYGFGDKGINKRITEWMCSSLRRKILIIDQKSPDALKESARRAIALKIDGWTDRWIHWSEELDSPRSPGNESQRSFSKQL